MNLHDEEETPGFFQRHRIAVIAGAVVLAGALAYFFFSHKPEPKRKAHQPIMNIMPVLPPPPPPPTPPPTPPPPQERPPDNPKQPEFQPEEQPVNEPPKPEPPDEPPPALGTNIKGDGGNDGFGLAAGGGNGMIGGTGNGKGGGGSKWGSYAGQVQSRVVDALRSHRRTRSASLSIKVRIWVDDTGRVTRASLTDSSGDAALDKAIRDEVLSGLQLAQPPPEGMPMPIVMRISAKRPN